MIVYPLEQICNVCVRLKQKSDAHRPVEVLVLGIARMQKVLLHKDARVLKLFMVSVGADVRSLRFLEVPLVAFGYLEQEVLQQLDVISLSYMLKYRKCMIKQVPNKLLFLPFIVQVPVSKHIYFLSVKYHKVIFVRLIMCKIYILTRNEIREPYVRPIVLVALL